MKTVNLIIANLLFALWCKGQELPLYSQYILNPYLINPAIAGIDGCGNIQAVSSNKWIGMKEAPRSYAVSYHQGFNKIGLGSYVFSDRNGLNSDLGLQVTFAYHINIEKTINKAKQLSFGLSLCGKQHTLDESKFTDNGYDPIVTNTMQSTFIPNANVGVYYISNNFFSGLSCTNLYNPKNNIYTSNLEPINYRNYFIQVGYLFEMKRKYFLEPSITTKFSESGTRQIDTNIKFLFNTQSRKKIWFAFSYRNNIDIYAMKSATYMPMVGLNNSNYSIAYAFNYSTNAISNSTLGSHEIMLGYHFFIKRRRPVACPAFRSFRALKE